MSIEIKNLYKSYGKKEALHDVTVSFGENKIYGLLGCNGAGKSTLINIISNRIFKTSGILSVDGTEKTDSSAVQSKIYTISEDSYLDYGMKAGRAFKETAQFYGGFDTELAFSLAGKFGLSLNSRIHSLSTGYRSIYKIISALAVNTPYLILDEPTLGLDAAHRDLFYKLLIEKYSSSPCTVIISTHLINEIANVIENAVIIDRGRIIKSQPIEELMSSGYTVTGKAALIDEYVKNKSTAGADSLGGLKSVFVEGKPDRGSLPAGLEISSPDLQRLFVKLTEK